MANRKTNKQDTRSTITIQLSAAYAEFVVRLLLKEMESARRKRQMKQAADILKILKSFLHAIEFEEKQRSQRGRTEGERAQKS